MHHLCNYTPHQKIILFGNLDRLEFIVGWHEINAVFLDCKALQREFAINCADSNAAIFRLLCFVDNKQVAILNTGVFH